MIELQNLNEQLQEDTLRRVRQRKYAQGTCIEYAQGDYSDLHGASKLGKSVRALFDAGAAHLVQRIISEEPRKYSYQMVTR